MAETWRVVLASGEVREVSLRRERTVWVAEQGNCYARNGDPVWCVAEFVRAAFSDIPVEILAPGEPTRAELAAQLAAVTAERDVALEECSTLRRGLDHADGVIDHTRASLGAADDEGASVAAQRVTRELAALRAQQAPLLACVDAMRAAATSAGWRDADATGETLVAWVRRGEREACARVADDEARDSRGNEGAVCAAQSIAAKIRGREGGE